MRIEKLSIGIIAALALACGGVKQTQKALNSGDYDSAINEAVENLRSNKTKKNKQPYVLMLEEAFPKAVNKDVEDIRFLEKDGNPANLEVIYETYLRLDRRQERIKPLLPLPVLDKNRNARFSFEDYTDEIIDAKNKLSDYLYINASRLLNSSRNKGDYRKAYDDLLYLNNLSPNYRDTADKLEEARYKGTDFVKVLILNETDKVLPKRLEDDLLNFTAYGINNLWTVYHSNVLENVRYDYDMTIAFRNILISPEQVRERQLVKEKQVKDGWKYLEDGNGKVVKDSLGNPIKVDKFKTITCNFYEFTQYKSVQVQGQVTYTDLVSRQLINTYPLTSEFVFQHVYANYQGDKMALDNDLILLLDKRAVPFPSNEQMIYDAGEDLKNRIKGILTRQQF